MSENKDGMEKNIDVIKTQWDNYKSEVREVIIPGIKTAWKEDRLRVPHKAHAFVEEFFDKQPRVNSYLVYPLIAGIVWLALGA